MIRLSSGFWRQKAPGPEAENKKYDENRFE
jgi:hypothetical protein